MKLHPVISQRDPMRLGRAGVEEGRRLGRLCLARSARLADAPHPPPLSGDSAGAERLPQFPRNPAGAPKPYTADHGSWHWSTTNTHGLAAGVVAPCPVALDAEWLARPRLAAVRTYFDEAELRLLADGDAPRELVLWTAKEAVLKLAGIGLAGLPRCRLVAVETCLVIEFEARRHDVHSLIVGEHVLACVSAADSPHARWQLHQLEEVPA